MITWWALCCFLLVLAGTAVALWLIRWSGRRDRAQEPSCSQCGYAVRGLPTFTCPECGSDLREVGIVTPVARRPVSPFWLVVIWSLILPAPAAMVTLAIAQVLPTVTIYKGDCILRPRSEAYAYVSVAVAGRSRNGRPMKGTVLRFDLGGEPDKVGGLEVDLPDLGCRYTNATGTKVGESAELDANTILEWMNTGGVDVASDAVRAEAVELLDLARAAARADNRFLRVLPRVFRGVTTFGTRSQSTCPARKWFLSLAALLWLAVWLAGIRRLLKRRSSAAPSARLAHAPPLACHNPPRLRRT